MIRSILTAAAFCGLLSGTASAQAYGLPPALAPCGEDHLDMERYRAELAELGWSFVEEDDRAEELELLGDTFVALVGGTEGPRETRLEQGRAVWEDLGRGGLVFAATDGAQVLLIGSGLDGDGATQVRCWMAFDDGSRLDELYAQVVDPDADAPASGEEQTVVLTQAAKASGRPLLLFLTRPTPGTETPATHAGIATVLTVAEDASR